MLRKIKDQKELILRDHLRKVKSNMTKTSGSKTDQVVQKQGH